MLGGRPAASMSSRPIDGMHHFVTPPTANVVGILREYNAAMAKAAMAKAGRTYRYT